MKEFKLYFFVFFATAILAIIDFLLLKGLVSECNIQSFHYSVPILFTIFGLGSLVVLFIQKKVFQKNPEQVGYVFLLVTSLKTAASYALVHPVLQQTSSVAKLEKINFFGVFVVFLIIDVVLTAIILKDVGKKDSNS